MTDRIRHAMIPHLIAELNRDGIAGLPEYEQKLWNNAGNATAFRDHFLEADVALMFSRHGFAVTMQDSPDLRIELDGEVAYAEVTHFREKEQDTIDERAMRDSEDLVLVGNVAPTERGSDAWRQVAGKAKSKKHQYREGAPNILVIETSSNAIGGTILSTAVALYNKWAASNEKLQRLNAFMLVDQWAGGTGNVHFCQADRVAISMNSKLRDALARIQDWQIPTSLEKIPYTLQGEPGDSQALGWEFKPPFATRGSG